MDGFIAVALGVLALAGIIALLLLPGFIAFRRQNPYKWIIGIVGVTSPVFLGASWLIAIIWAAWPSNRSLIDPIVGNPTGSDQNAGDSIGNVVSRFTTVSGGPKLEKRLAEIDSLHLRGMISDSEKDTLRSRAIEG